MKGSIPPPGARLGTVAAIVAADAAFGARPVPALVATVLVLVASCRTTRPLRAQLPRTGYRLAVATLLVASVTRQVRADLRLAGLAFGVYLVVSLVVDAIWSRVSLGDATLLVGTADDVRRAAQMFIHYPGYRVRPVATATDDLSLSTVLPGGGYEDIVDLVARHDVRHVLVVSAGSAPALAPVFGELRTAGVRVSEIPALAEHLSLGAQLVQVRGLPMLTLAPRPAMAGPEWWAKRVLDVAVASLLLVALAPVFLLVAIAIRCDDGGPVFFRQARMGRHGREFTLLKFRSMVRDAERRLEQVGHLNQCQGPSFKAEADPRVTRVGRLLRRFFVDELPQLVNVLRGDMSLVGPRPGLAAEVEKDPEYFSWRGAALPGMTGLWQIAGRSWMPRAEGIRMDRAYLESWSLNLDLRILLHTVRVAAAGDRRAAVIADGSLSRLSPARWQPYVVGKLSPADPGADPDLSVVIVTHESAADIDACLSSLLDLPDPVRYEVVVVDNASRDGTAELVARYAPRVRLVRKNRRDGFATNCNIGVATTSGRHVLLLNPDTVMTPGTLTRLVDHLDTHPAVGAVGPRLLWPDGRLQPSARRFPTLAATLVRRTPLRLVFADAGSARRHLMLDTVLDGPSQVDWLLGAAVAVRRSALAEVDGLDHRYRLYCEDIDLCWRLHQVGWRVEYLPTATVLHDLSELTYKRFLTVRTLWHVRSMARFIRLHGLRGPVPAVRIPEPLVLPDATPAGAVVLPESTAV